MPIDSRTKDPCAVLNSNLSSALEFTSGVLGDLLNANVEPPPAITDELKHLMLNFIELEEEVNVFSKAIKEVELTPGMDVNVEISSSVEEIKSSRMEFKSKNHPQYVKLMKMIEEITNPIDFGSAKTSEIDDELLMTEEVNLIDPITKQMMTDPVRNRHCGHNYERSTILQHIRRTAKRSTKCPIIGCANSHSLKEKDLEDNIALKKYIKQKKQKK